MIMHMINQINKNKHETFNIKSKYVVTPNHIINSSWALQYQPMSYFLPNTRGPAKVKGNVNVRLVCFECQIWSDSTRVRKQSHVIKQNGGFEITISLKSQEHKTIRTHQLKFVSDIQKCKCCIGYEQLICQTQLFLYQLSSPPGVIREVQRRWQYLVSASAFLELCRMC